MHHLCMMNIDTPASASYLRKNTERNASHFLWTMEYLGIKLELVVEVVCPQLQSILMY